MQMERFDVTDLFTDECTPARICLTDLADAIFFTDDPEWRKAHTQALREIFQDTIRVLEVNYETQRIYAVVDTPHGVAIADICTLPITHVCFKRQQPIMFPRSGRYN
ncbi:MAG: hypothetical protein Q8L34_03570 [Candidatus Woesearchaeota archaeon]|nr:hypothetical protein [Candidatus Woesearchaeota archaeon]